MFLKLVLMTLFYSSHAYASVYLESKCPNQFEGEVISITAIDEVDHIMAKDLIKVQIENADVGSEFIEFKYLKHAMQYVEIGKTYKIGMRGDKICRLEEVIL